MPKKTVRRKVTAECLFCGAEFESTLRWEGIPEEDYCSEACEKQDEDFGGSQPYEKFTKNGNEEWS